MSTGDIFIMTQTGIDDPFSSKTNVSRPSPSSSSARSGPMRGVSVFGNSDAGTALPRDVEMSFSLYDTEKNSDRASYYSTNSASSQGIVPMSGGSSSTKTTTTTTTKKNSYSINGAGIHGAIPESAKPNEKDSGNVKLIKKTSSTTIDTNSNSKDNAKSSITTSIVNSTTSGAKDTKPPGSKVAVKKAGSFQLKSGSAAPGASPADSSASTSQTEDTSTITTPGESYSRMYKAKTTVVTKTTKQQGGAKSTTTQQGSKTTTTTSSPSSASVSASASGSSSMAVKREASLDKSPSKDMTMPLKIATSGQRVVPKPTAIEQKEQEDKQEKQKQEVETASSKTSLSSSVSEPLSSPSSSSASGSPTKAPELSPLESGSGYKSGSGFKSVPGPKSGFVKSTTSEIKSATSSLSNLSSESSALTVTEVDITKPSASASSSSSTAGKVSTQSSSSSSAAAKTTTKSSSSSSKALTTTTTTKTTSQSVSPSSSKVQSTTTVIEKTTVSKSPPPPAPGRYEHQDSLTSSLTNVSTVSETSSIVKNKDFKAKMSNVMAAQSPPPSIKPKPKFEFKAAEFKSSSGDVRSPTPTDPPGGVYKSLPTSPIAEMKDTITEGKVGNLAKSGMFKHLTGRSIDPSTLERKKKNQSKSSGDLTSPTSPGEKKYRFEVEGIDVPEREKSEEDENEKPATPITPPAPLILGPDGIPLPPPPPPPPPGAEDTKSLMRKKGGFSYVTDDILSSAIVKKAEDVTARKAYEQVEDKVQTRTKQSDANKDTTVFVEAKAKLHKRESSNLDEPMSPSPKQPNDLLMDEIRSKLRKSEGGSTDVTKTASSFSAASSSTGARQSAATEKTTITTTTTTTEVPSIVKTKEVITTKKSNSSSFKAKAVEPYEASRYETEAETDRAKSPLLRQDPIDDNTPIYAKVKKKTDRKAREEDTIDSYTTSSLSKRAISQQDIIKAALTSESFLEDYQNNNQTAFSSSGEKKGEEKNAKTKSKQPTADRQTVTTKTATTAIEEKKKNGAENVRDRHGSNNLRTTTTTTATTNRSQGEGAVVVEVNSNTTSTESVTAAHHNKNKRTEHKSKNKSGSNSRRTHGSGSLDVIDTEHTTWTLRVEAPETGDDGQLSQLSTTSSRRRVPYERIQNNQAGIVNIDLGERDEVDEEIERVTGPDDRGRGDSRYNSTGVIRVTHHHHSTSSAGESSSTLRGGQGHLDQSDGLPEDKIVYHLYRRDKNDGSDESGSGTEVRRYTEQQRYTDQRYLSPAPHPVAGSLHSSRAASRSNSSLVNLLPLSVDVGVHHPGSRSRAKSGGVNKEIRGDRGVIAGVMASSAATNQQRQFNTSQMRATSTLNTHTTTTTNQKHHNHSAAYHNNSSSSNRGSREVLNSTGSSNEERRDVNMNNLKSPRGEPPSYRLASSPRYLAGEQQSGPRTPIRRSQSGRHVSNVSYSSGGDVPMFDTLDGSTGKYRVQKVMDRRRVAGNDLMSPLPMDIHPDVAYKRQKFYSVARETHTNNNGRRNGAIVSASPELENASKTGGNYNVTLKLNTSQLGGGGESVTEREEREEREEYEEQMRMQQRQIQREREDRAEQMRLEQMKTERLLAEREERLRLQKIKAQLQREEHTEQIRLEALRQQRQRQEDEERMRLEQIRAARMMEEMEEREEYKRLEQLRADRIREQREELEEQARLERLRAERMREEQAEHEEYLRLEQLRAQRLREEQRQQMISPVSPRYVATAQLNPEQVQSSIERIQFTNYHGPRDTVVSQQQQQQRRSTHIVTDIGSKKTTKQRSTPPLTNGGEPPRFTMCIDQTMKMDYVPTGDDTPVQEQNNVKRSRPREQPQPQRRQEPVDEMLSPNRVDPYHQPNNNNWPDSESDSDTSENTVEEDHIERAYPQVVRGSILIKNSIDTTSAPKVFDVVEDEVDGSAYEENTNMFENHYFQARENPMYNSDTDLSKSQGTQQPQFTRLFQETQKTQNTGAAPPRQNGHFTDNESDIEIPVSRESYHTYKRTQFDQTDGRSASKRPPAARATASSSSHTTKTTKTSSSEFEISSLLKDAPPDSIKQTINVEREEEEIIGPLPESEDGSDPAAMLNFDTVSEKVDLGLVDGVAQVAVKVRCERIVPIRGVEDMFKKSSVIVTRLIEIDLTSTEERRRLYDNIMRNSTQAMITDAKGKTRRTAQPKLSTKQTFNLYKTFMGMAEVDEESKKNEYVQIDRRVEEEQMPQFSQQVAMENAMNGNNDNHVSSNQMDDEDESETDIEELDRKLEAQIAQYAKMKAPEPDAESYMSAVSENHSMMY